MRRNQAQRLKQLYNQRIGEVPEQLRPLWLPMTKEIVTYAFNADPLIATVCLADMLGIDPKVVAIMNGTKKGFLALSRGVAVAFIYNPKVNQENAVKAIFAHDRKALHKLACSYFGYTFPRTSHKFQFAYTKEELKAKREAKQKRWEQRQKDPQRIDFNDVPPKDDYTNAYEDAFNPFDDLHWTPRPNIPAWCVVFELSVPPVEYREARAAYYKLLKQHHPDNLHADEAKTKKLNNAWEQAQAYYGKDKFFSQKG